MAMKQMTSSVRSTPYSLTSAIASLKKAQDDTTARMGSDKVAVFGTADPDFIGFLTPALQTMKPVTVQSGNGSYGAVAILPEQQHATLEDRYYHAGTPFVMDRAGTAVTGLNILRSGKAPAGYYGGDKVMIQKRQKRYFREPDGLTDFHFIWEVAEVRREPKGYLPGGDERFDGDFFPGNVQMGFSPPFGWTFPTDDKGRLLYTGDPYTDAGWSGAVSAVIDNEATKPVIDSISLTSFTLGVDGPQFLNITGSNFTGAGWVFVGPFAPQESVFAPRPNLDDPDNTFNETTTYFQQPDGAYYARDIVDDNIVSVFIPGPDWVAGTYDVFVIGNDGQIGRLEKAFTIIDGE